MNTNAYVDFVMVIIMFSILAIGWFFIYVQPNDKFLHEVMDCMDDDRSRQAYDRCVGN